MRPQHLDQYVGQKHLVGPGAVLRKMIESGNLSSFILWGPPGVGKTTLAKIVASQMECPFFTLSAIASGVKEVREVIDKARNSRFFDSKPPVLFIDEIHRFNKAQQDSLLAAVENGTFILIGATTENPSFEVITPLLSRCQVYTLKALEESDLDELRKIDAKVTNTSAYVAILVGIVGVLTFGTGLSLVLSFNKLILGIIVSFFGLVIMGFGYASNKIILNKMKKKYAPRVLELSEKLLRE